LQPGTGTSVVRVLRLPNPADYAGPSGDVTVRLFVRSGSPFANLGVGNNYSPFTSLGMSLNAEP